MPFGKKNLRKFRLTNRKGGYQSRIQSKTTVELETIDADDEAAPQKCVGIPGFDSLDKRTLSAVFKDNLTFSSACLGTITHGNESKLCEHCTKLKNAMRMRLKRAKSVPHPNTRLTYMTNSQLQGKIKSLTDESRSQVKTISKLKKTIEDLRSECISLNQTAEDEIKKVILNTEKSGQPKLSSDLQNLLWADQVKQANSKANGMRWHPAIIRWALTIRYLSKSTYNYIRDSGALTLPAASTLQSYTAYKTMDFGVDYESINLLSEQLNDNRDIVLLHDEMKMKDKLVYDRNTGQLTGFVMLDEVTNALTDLVVKTREHATHAVCFMARSTRSRVSLPVAHYCSSGLSADQIYQMFWRIVGLLEVSDIKVRASVSDGAGSNRKFFEMHRSDYNDDITYRAKNRYDNTRSIFFISDVPHLLKTSRNCFENSHGNKNSRNLVLHGKPIKWGHVTNLYEQSLKNTSFTKLHKLTAEHVRLSSYSRMRVNLAAQVLSQRVADSLKQVKDEALSSTIEFIEKLNKVFDLLNIRYEYEGEHGRNLNKVPFRKQDDERFEWLDQHFIGWLNAWEQEVLGIDGLTRQEIEQAQLSQQTIVGWKLTCKSFTELTRQLLTEGYDYVLSEKLVCQDAVEQHFAHQRRAGGANHNPTAAEYLRSEKKFSVLREMQLPSKSGNCRGGVLASKTLAIDDTTIAKSRKDSIKLKKS